MDTTTASMAYGDDVELSQFTYKKVHHFEESMKKFQAKGSKRVEKWVIMEVMQWLYDKEYGQREKITPTLCRQALKDRVFVNITITGCKFTVE
jgi:hypothetical protein